LTLEVVIVNLGGSARLLSLLLKSVTTFLNNLAEWDWCFFFTSAIQCRKMWNGIWRRDWKSTFI